MYGPPDGSPLWLHPDDDLAPNQPGESLRAQLDSARRGRLARWCARRLGRPVPEHDAAQALRAAEASGAALERLGLGGWHALHALPLPGGARVSHLLVGPGGVFALSSNWYPATRAVVADDEVRGAEPLPLVRHCRRAATLATYALSRAASAEIPVRGVLILVGATRIVRSPEAAPDITALREGDIHGAFARHGGLLTTAEVDRLYALARDRRTWQLT